MRKVEGGMGMEWRREWEGGGRGECAVLSSVTFCDISVGVMGEWEEWTVAHNFDSDKNL